MRNLDSNLSAAIISMRLAPAFLASLTFKSGVRYVWSGVGTLEYGSQQYVGVGSLADIGAVVEGVDVNAAGTTLSLSGIDTTWLNECLTDIKPGAPAKLWFGTISPQGYLVGAPYLLFSGTVDKPTVSIGPDKSTISLALENRLVDLQRATNLRYTAAAQHVKYPDDTALNFVEMLNDISLVWGS